MAQDIIITPRSAEPSIAFTGSGTTASSISLKVLSDSTLSFEGTQGQLFSITDNLTSGVIFGVNDIGGLPLIEASANGNVSLVRYGNNVGIGTGSPTAKLDILETWNTSAVQTGIKLNVTDISSNSASLLMDLQVSSSSKFKIYKQSQQSDVSGWDVFLSTGSSVLGGIMMRSDTGKILGLRVHNAAGPYIRYSNDLVFESDGFERARFSALGNFSVRNILNIGSTASTGDVQLSRDDAGILAQRNGTAAQTFRLYNTYTNTSNYERASLSWDANTFKIQTEASGTGSGRSILLGTNSTLRMTIGSAGNVLINSNHLSIGNSFYRLTESSGKLKWEYTGVTTGVTLGWNGQIDVGSGGSFSWRNLGSADIGLVDTSLSRASAAVVRVTSSIEALSSISAPTVSAVNYYNTSGALPTTLQELYDVSSTALPAEGYILIYTGGKWVALPPVIDGGSA